ncbi:CYTH domain-containing protein [Aureibacillus halotolerans]|uniref:Uncharacterized protein YjbK n=1 Tax=Aureibacillus halotolerans TaxID=1508390 RepID=A0A4R6U741_9BACI|nr:CYTH domain-containing protein [Aureibacillus halotolerans]TDQ42141.1 uncharacterized protein YjbK [Aureibacillus halotolerans]
MHQEQELEWKNLLNEDEFQRLYRYYQFQHDDFIQQTNHYFDTSDFLLRSSHAALRIREKGGQYTLTLKQPHPSGEGLLETHQPLEVKHAQQILTDGHCKTPEAMQPSLSLIGRKTLNVKHIGTLMTRRSIREMSHFTLFLDHSFYGQKEDYELEIEATSVTAGEQAFLDILRMHNIPKRETLNKIARLFT